MEAEKLCRLCLKQPTTSVQIFSSDIPQVIETLTSLKVEENDGLPSISCQSCIADLLTAYETRNRIINSDKLFRSQYISHSESPKETSIIDNDPLSIANYEVCSSQLPDEYNFKPELDYDCFGEINDCESGADEAEGSSNEEVSEILDDNDQSEAAFKRESTDEEQEEADDDCDDLKDDTFDISNFMDDFDDLKFGNSSALNDDDSTLISDLTFSSQEEQEIIPVDDSATGTSSDLKLFTSRLQEATVDKDYEIVALASDVLERRNDSVYCKICNIQVKCVKPYNHRNKHMKARCKICGVVIRLDSIPKHMLCHKPELQVYDNESSVGKDYEIVTLATDVLERKNGKVYCKICEVRVESVKAYNHRSKHMKAKCKICGVVIRLDCVRKHMLCHKSGQVCQSTSKIEVEKDYEILTLASDILERKNGKIYCQICKIYVERRKAYNHRNKHMKVKCKICGIVIRFDSVRKHMQGHKSTREKDSASDLEKKYEIVATAPDILERRNGKVFCKICNVQIKLVKPYMHRNKHTKARCKLCGIVIRLDSVRRHMQSHKPGVQISDNDNNTDPDFMPTSPAESSQQTPIEEEFEVITMASDIIEKRNGKYHCNICEIEVEGGMKMILHRNKHMKAKCKICGIVVRADNVRKHILCHKSGPQVCDICGTVYKSIEGLRTHVFHFHKNRKNYKCDECDEEFKYSSKLCMHKRRVHIGIRPHQCDICGKAFFESDMLKKHRNMVHLNLRFQCEFCNKGYSSPYALKTHRRQHTGELPYVCEYCCAGFRQKVSLKTHLKSKHSIMDVTESDNQNSQQLKEDEEQETV